MSEEQIAELNAWAYQPLTGDGYVRGLVLRLMDERKTLLAVLRKVTTADASMGEIRDAIAKAEQPRVTPVAADAQRAQREKA